MLSPARLWFGRQPLGALVRRLGDAVNDLQEVRETKIEGERPGERGGRRQYTAERPSAAFLSTTRHAGGANGARNPPVSGQKTEVGGTGQDGAAGGAKRSKG